MPWTYHQATGCIEHEGKLEGSRGYASRGSWKNDPDAENQKDAGPLPRGSYKIADHFIHSPNAGKHGVRPTALPRNQMSGRSGCLITDECSVEDIKAYVVSQQMGALPAQADLLKQSTQALGK